MESSLGNCAMRLPAFRCSTPCGINGIFTPGAGACDSGALVLNALRHQWNLHPPCTCRSRMSCCVLNALRHQWNLHTDTGVRMVACCCAQRLAASMESSHWTAQPTTCQSAVLNALRHQWNLHRILRTRSSNVTGAQRLAASMESSPVVAARLR